MLFCGVGSYSVTQDAILRRRKLFRGARMLFRLLPLSLGEVESDGGALLEWFEEDGLLLGFLGHEVGDGEHVG